MHVEDGPVVELDRWVLSVWPNEEVSTEVTTQLQYEYYYIFITIYTVYTQQ